MTENKKHEMDGIELCGSCRVYALKHEEDCPKKPAGEQGYTVLRVKIVVESRKGGGWVFDTSDMLTYGAAEELKPYIHALRSVGLNDQGTYDVVADPKKS